MTLPDSLKIVRGTALVFSNSGEYVPTVVAGAPTGTDADIDLGNLAISGVARQSVKMDIGSVNIDVEYELRAYIEWHTSPTAGGTVDFYVTFSDSATAANNNDAGCDGTDSLFQGYGADAASGTEALKQLDLVGQLTATADTTVQVEKVGVFTPTAQYVILVVVNNSSVALAATDAIETAVVMTPLTLQIQD